MGQEKILLEHTPAARKVLAAYLAVSGTVLLLMMTLGLLMRLAQGSLVSLPADRFYESLTVHGTGMVGVAGMGGAAILWYFLGRHVRLNVPVLAINLVAFIVGAALILGAAFIGGFAAGWTFLFPLPANSLGQWSEHAAAMHLSGLLLIGTGFLLFHLDTGRAILSKYGSLARALGWPYLFGRSDETPPAVIVASTMVLIVNTLGLVSGATVLAISLVNLYLPGFAIDPLLAKNLIYFFGHVFINITIYMAIIAAYELLPLYTNRPWKVNRPFLVAWTAATVLVLVAYPHHLLMDFNMPRWLLLVGQISSYISGLPILVVTGYGALMIVFRSGMRWTTTTALIMVGVFGWSSGVIPAIIDATIMVNTVMHNTLWVPGHFHTYLLLGQIALVLAFMAHFSQGADWSKVRLNAWGFWLFLIGGLALTQSFLYSGKQGVPRRFAEYLPDWVGGAQVGALAALMVVTGTGVLFAAYLLKLPRVMRAS
ncbi:MAG TPA: cbb3-type cytochrome c oxidase subunit I [Azospirillum sp.]|nr:cbb3-type cytochrome c oxidase subunit I [Azospirillum sp.]